MSAPTGGFYSANPEMALTRFITDLRSQFETSKLRLEGDVTVSDMPSIVMQCNNLMQQLTAHLLDWRNRNNYKILRVNQDDFNNLDEFSDLFSAAYHYLSVCESTFQHLADEARIDVTTEARDVSDLMQRLLSMSFVIEQHPCQAMKIKDSKSVAVMEEDMNVIIRCLLPECWNSRIPPKVTVRDKESKSKSKSANVTIHSETSNSQKFVWNRIVVKGKLQGLKPMKKHDKRLYIVKFEFLSDTKISAVVETLPMGFYTHTTQMPVLTAHILWYNAFSTAEHPCIVQTRCPESTTMQEMWNVLDTEFHDAGSFLAKSLKSTRRMELLTGGVRFNDYNRECLADMLDCSGPRDLVTVDKFLRAKIGYENKFTFWEWFYACYKTKCEYLQDLYNKFLVVGFITKERADDVLKRCLQNDKPGNRILLLRFSTKYIDEHHGYISPSLIRVADKPEHGKPIKASKYKKDERKLGRILLVETGEEIEKLRVVCAGNTDWRCVNFADADGFANFLEEVEQFECYTNLNHEVDESVVESRSRASESSFAVASPAPSDASSASTYHLHGIQEHLPPIEGVFGGQQPLEVDNGHNQHMLLGEQQMDLSGSDQLDPELGQDPMAFFMNCTDSPNTIVRVLDLQDFGDSL